MKKYYVEKRGTEITSSRTARSAYEGMTLDDELNRYDLTPTETHAFDTEEEARKFLNQQENDYYYNGSGHGWAHEWWLSSTELDEDGEETDADIEDICHNSNLKEFLAGLIE